MLPADDLFASLTESTMYSPSSALMSFSDLIPNGVILLAHPRAVHESVTIALLSKFTNARASPSANTAQRSPFCSEGE